MLTKYSTCNEAYYFYALTFTLKDAAVSVEKPVRRIAKFKSYKIVNVPDPFLGSNTSTARSFTEAIPICRFDRYSEKANFLTPKADFNPLDRQHMLLNMG